MDSTTTEKEAKPEEEAGSTKQLPNGDVNEAKPSSKSSECVISSSSVLENGEVSSNSKASGSSSSEVAGGSSSADADAGAGSSSGGSSKMRAAKVHCITSSAKMAENYISSDESEDDQEDASFKVNKDLADNEDESTDEENDEEDTTGELEDDEEAEDEVWFS